MKESRVVVLYGSHARGEQDELSDIDILVVGETEPRLKTLAAELSLEEPMNANISHYNWAEFQAMHEYGSVFLHHLHAEGKILFADLESRQLYLSMLNSLPRYQRVERDLISFRIAINDCINGLNSGIPPKYELSVLGGVVRHASVLGCYLLGSPRYGRDSIPTALELVGMTGLAGDFTLSHSFTKAEAGLQKFPDVPSKTTVLRFADHVHEFIDRIESHAKAA